MRYQIRFTTECNMKTVLGLTECKAEKTISAEDATDIYIVEELTDYLYKALNCGNHVLLTAELIKDYDHLESFGRLCMDYRGMKSGLQVVWHRDGKDVDTFEIDNINKKFVKKWYLDIIQRARLDYIDNPLYNAQSA